MSEFLDSIFRGLPQVCVQNNVETALPCVSDYLFDASEGITAPACSSLSVWLQMVTGKPEYGAAEGLSLYSDHLKYNILKG